MARLGIEGVGILEVLKGGSAEEAGLIEVKQPAEWTSRNGRYNN